MSFYKGEVRVEDSQVSKSGKGFEFPVQDLQPYRDFFDDNGIDVGKTGYLKVDTGMINETGEPVRMNGVMVLPGRGDIETLRELGFRAVAAERGVRVRVNGVHMPDGETTDMTVQVLEKRELTDEQKAKRQKGADDARINERTKAKVATWEQDNKRRVSEQQYNEIREAESKLFYEERAARQKKAEPQPIKKQQGQKAS